MHQHPRVPPITASPARSPQTNPMRTNNSRDNTGHARQASENSAPGEQGIYLTEGVNPGNTSRDTSPEGKLDLIIQNYFYKAALMILDARTAMPQAFTTRDNKPRVNRWFNTELPETDELLQSTKQWKNASALRNRPPNMVVETYIDLKDLASNQKLVVLDDHGKRHDVEASIKNHLGGYLSNDAQLRRYNIILERWVCELGQPWPEVHGDFPLNEILPKVYKGSIVLYRSLFAHLKFMPAWKLHKRASKPHLGQTMPRIRWRIYDPASGRSNTDLDELEVPLSNSRERVTETIRWDPVDSPAGQFSIKATYRLNSDFRIDTSESLFNSQFMASDEQWFEPSLPQSSVFNSQKGSTTPILTDPGSLPLKSREVPARSRLNEIAEKGPAYGSMSTFHNTGGKIGTSPLSALRAARDLNARSPTDLSPRNITELRPGMSSTVSRRSVEASSRRASISMQPFKTPTFSSSVPSDQGIPSSSRVTGANRNSPLVALAEARNPSASLQMPSSPRTSPKLADALPVSSTASSPRPTPARFSSSFSHRRNRASLGGSSNRAEDDNASSDRGSNYSSNMQPGNEGIGANFVQTDDENISEFLKMLDSKKELKSFRSSGSPSATISTTRGATAALSKFQQLRDSHAALSDSLSSSQILQRSNTSSSSRQLANVPAMVAGTSTSIASSPGERISPRTPHTPAIPSRLSSNSIVEYNQTERSQRQRPHRFYEGEDISDAGESHESQQTIALVSDNNGQTAGAIPIPTSPRAYQPNYRRSSSAAAHNNNRERNSRHNGYVVTDEITSILPFALRSASLGDGDEREPLSLSDLIRLQEATVPIPTGVPPPSDLDGQNLVETSEISHHVQVEDAIVQRHEGEMNDGVQNEVSSRQRAEQGLRPFARHSFSRPIGLTNFEDDEPLLFAMSEQLEGTGSSHGTGRNTATSGSGGGSTRESRMQQW